MAKPKDRPPSKQKLLYQQAWLRAAALTDGLKLNFKTRAGAFEARRHLYEAVRSAKDRPMDHRELANAAEAIQIVWAGETSLWMRHRDSNDATTGLEHALGMKVDEMMDPEALEQLRKAQELQERLKKGDDLPELGGHQDNPFYRKRS